MNQKDELHQDMDQEFIEEYREDQAEDQWPSITDWSEFL